MTKGRLREWCLTAATVTALLVILMSIDSRVQRLSTQVIGEPGAALTEAGGEIASRARSASYAARGYAMDNTPLVTFTLAGLVLLAFMLRDR